MAIYNLAPIFKPQYVDVSATALTLATAGTTIPTGYYYQIAVIRVSNVTSAPVSLQVWRVPSGSAADNQHLVVPSVNVPVASQTFMDLDLTALWGAVLQPGDSIWMEGGAGNSLVVHADGAIIQI